MAGYVKLFRSIWNDPDFRALTRGQQQLYMLLISQQDLSNVGVLSLTVGRWSSLAADGNPADVRADLAVLAARRFVIIDETTEELLIRAYIARDDNYNSPNGRKALLRAYGEVLSELLRSNISTILNHHGVTTREASPQGASQGASQAPCSPQQQQPAPAASTSSSSTAPRPARPTTPAGDALPPSAAAAIELFIEHRTATVNPHNPTGFARGLRRDETATHGPALRAHLATHPDATPAQLATAVLGLTELDLYALTHDRKGR